MRIPKALSSQWFSNRSFNSSNRADSDGSRSNISSVPFPNSNTVLDFVVCVLSSVGCMAFPGLEVDFSSSEHRGPEGGVSDSRVIVLIRQILYSKGERQVIVYLETSVCAQDPIIVEPDVFRGKEGKVLCYLLPGV